jgi:uncharacterized protein (TIGR03437 family)
VSLFGTNVSSTTTSAGSVPLPTALSGTSLLVAGQAVPLFFANNNQMNFQLPFDLSPNGQAQVVLMTPASNSFLVSAAPQTIAVGTNQPAVFTLNSSGTGQGAIQINGTAIYAAPSGSVPGSQAQPVAKGQYITIYCTGLGDVSNRPATGMTAPSSPLSAALITPTVTIGGVAAPVNFAGLAPGYVGLYQINALVPQGAASGPTISLMVTQAGVTSNPVTLAIQ